MTAGVIDSRNSVDRSEGVRSYATEYYCRSTSRTNFHVLTGAQVIYQHTVLQRSLTTLPDEQDCLVWQRPETVGKDGHSFWG
jgi:hypothetical protein